ncbi:MAG: hypothetical protein J5I62_01115 [Flavobacteriales bacterium]|nr:hypothetical protein [Flavobacteriales bacterium]MEB2342304.1 hypothetical protein [Flavobacteriia bacterium]
MKQIVINTESQAGTTAYGLFQREGLAPGDSLLLMRRPRLPQDTWLTMVMLVMLAARHFLKRKGSGEPRADELLLELRSNNGAQELRKELKEEFNVEVILDPEADDEREFWANVGLWGLSRAYAEDEPDISQIKLLEPNPDYIPWKPGT